MPPFFMPPFDAGLFVFGVFVFRPFISFSLCDGYGWGIQSTKNQIPWNWAEPGKAAAVLALPAKGPDRPQP